MALGKKQKRGSGEVPELGAIFMSNRATKKMCFSWKTFGLPYSRASFVKQVKAGMFLFLFEHETRTLYGVYQACKDGEMNFSSEAFSSAGNKYPAQVQFKVLWYCKPLCEDEFRPVIKDNYFTAKKFNFGLSRNQVRELLWLFDSRKLRDERQEEMLLRDPSLIRGATRSCSSNDAGEMFTGGLQNENVPENADAPELDKDLERFNVPNREVYGRLLIEGDIRNGNGVADTHTALPLNNYRSELSQQDRTSQLRDITDYGCKLNNDYELNSGGTYLLHGERYGPDIPLFKNMHATQQLQRFHEVDRSTWDGGVYTGNTADGRPLVKDGGVSSSTSQTHVSLGMHHDVRDTSLNRFSYFCSSVPKICNDTGTNELRQSSTTCYSEPTPTTAYFGNVVDEGRSSFKPDSATSLQGLESCSAVHRDPDFFRSPSTAYFDNVVDEGRGSFKPDSATLQGLGSCSEVHRNPGFFRGSNNTISGEFARPLSENIALPSEIDDASILRQSAAYYNDPSQTISHPISSGHFQICMGIDSSSTKHPEDALLHSSASACNPLDINQDFKVCKERQPVPQNKRSVFSRLEPALDADDDNNKLKGPQKSIDDMVNEVMETLKGHYCQLVGESNSMTKHIDGGNNKSKSKSKESQTLQPEAARCELVAPEEGFFDVSTANEEYESKSERQIIGKNPCLNFKRRSEVQKMRNAAEDGLGKMSSAILVEKQCKRRKLVRPTFSEKKLLNNDGPPSNVSANFLLPCQPSQDGSLNTGVPTPNDKEQTPPEIGNLGSGVLAANVGGESSNGQSGSSNLPDGADMGMRSAYENHEGQSLSSPCEYPAMQLPKPSNLRSAVLNASVDVVKSSQQYTLNREEDDRAELFLTVSGNDKKDGYIMPKDSSFKIPPKGKPYHVKDVSIKNETGESSKDPNFAVDFGSDRCSVQLNNLKLNRTGDAVAETFMLHNGDHEKHGKAVCCNLNDGVTSNHVDEVLSTKMELGGSLNYAADARVDVQKQQFVSAAKSVELDGSQQKEFPNSLDMNTTPLLPLNTHKVEDSTMGRDEVHEEATSNNLLVDWISASSQTTGVQYFEFLNK